jgi:hypothetical protein
MQVSEASTEAPAESTDQASTDAVKPTETVDFWKAKARDWEGKAKANKSAAERLVEIEEANKTESQKTAERLAAAEKDAAEARREALKLRIATRFGIGDEDADLFLTGSDEETLSRQAERLGARIADQQKRGNVVPREGTNSSSVDNDKRQFAQQLFSE